MSDEILAAFAAESIEMLDAIEASIAGVAEGREDALQSLFRGVHTLKGSAGIVGLDRLEAFAHAWEARIASLRAGAAGPISAARPALEACRDRVADILAEAHPAVGLATSPEPAGLKAEDLATLEALDRALEPLLTRAAESPVPAKASGREAAEAGPDASRDRTSTMSDPAAPPPGIPAPAPAVPGATAPQAQGSGSSSAGYSRIPNTKIEAILAQTTELAQAVADLGLEAAASGSFRLVETAETLQSLSAKLYRSVLETRMIPFGDVADRYRRTVTEIARASRKSVRFLLEGADTEIDKSLADRLAEPLLHLVRNAADHGLEAPSERLAAGKGETGTLRLSARRDVGALVVRVEDDGRGIDPERVRLRAVESGLLSPEARPDREEILALLFAPGFSLSEAVTRWSGRGVGLDAVDRAARLLRGSVRLESEPGKGSVAEIRLPLALSLAEGFAAMANETELLVPYEAVVSCFEFTGKGESRPFGTLEHGGRLLPSLDLSLLYGGGPREGIRVAIVVRAGDAEAAILVDTVGRTISAPVRPIDRRFADAPGVAGTAALGDGSLVLVLDAPGAVRLAVSG